MTSEEESTQKVAQHTVAGMVDLVKYALRDVVREEIRLQLAAMLTSSFVNEKPGATQAETVNAPRRRGQKPRYDHDAIRRYFHQNGGGYVSTARHFGCSVGIVRYIVKRGITK